MESRMHGDMHVRFGGECLETNRRKAARRWALSLHNEENDVKKILSRNFFDENKRNEMQAKQLNISGLDKVLNFPILDFSFLKKI